MKSDSDLISLGHFMDDEQMDAIIPVSATSTHAIEGGPIVQQAVPEDYFLASICLRALHDLNGRDLEFIMKAYLPIRVLDIEKVNRIAFIESLGLVSSEINPLEYKVLEELVDIIDIIETEDDIFRSIDLFQKILDTLTKEREVSIAGLLSKAHNLIPYELLEWPSIPQREPFSFILSDNDNLPEIKQVSSLIDSTIEFVYHAHGQLLEVREVEQQPHDHPSRRHIPRDRLELELVQSQEDVRYDAQDGCQWQLSTLLH